MHRIKRSIYAHCVVLLSSVLASPLAAQDKRDKTPAPAAAPASPGSQEFARAAYGRGVEAYSAENYKLAHEQFSLAEEAFPSPNIELMLGRSLMKLGRWLEARALLQRAQAGSTTPKYANTAKLAAEELALTEKQLAHVELEIAGAKADDQLTINGNAVDRAAWAKPIDLDPGPVRIELSRPGVPKATKQFVLGPGEKQHVALSLPAPEPVAAAAPKAKAKAEQPAPAAALDATQAQPQPSDHAPPASESRSPWLRGLSYVLAGVGVAGFAGFVGFGVYSHDHYEKFDELCPAGKECHPSYRWLETKGQTYQTLANVSLVAGSVALAAGVTLWIVTISPGRAEVEVTSNSIRLRGSF
jgi:tetratricopeptide (TPR) repeat protein